MCWREWEGQPWLLLPKTLGLLDGIQQLLFQLLIALVGREVQAVEAVKDRRVAWGDQGFRVLPPPVRLPACRLPANSPCMASG